MGALIVCDLRLRSLTPWCVGVRGWKFTFSPPGSCAPGTRTGDPDRPSCRWLFRGRNSIKLRLKIFEVEREIQMSASVGPRLVCPSTFRRPTAASVAAPNNPVLAKKPRRFGAFSMPLQEAFPFSPRFLGEHLFHEPDSDCEVCAVSALSNFDPLPRPKVHIRGAASAFLVDSR